MKKTTLMEVNRSGGANFLVTGVSQTTRGSGIDRGRKMCPIKEEGGMTKMIRSILIAACLASLMTPALRARPGMAEGDRQLILPRNLYLSNDLRLHIEKIWLRSPMFRQQCERIGRTPNLVVTMKVTQRPLEFRAHDALTRVTKSGNGLTIATVRIFNPSRLVEMVGHEFEHIIEQIEGLNLHMASAMKKPTAYRSQRGIFETDRAVEAGRRVEDEYRSGKVRRTAADATEIKHRRRGERVGAS
jgi:hypothetical protein